MNKTKGKTYLSGRLNIATDIEEQSPVRGSIVQLPTITLNTVIYAQ